MQYDESQLQNKETAFKKRLGNRIKDYRLKAGLSQHQLALEANISRTQISRVENGEINTTVITLLRIVKSLKLTDEQVLDLLK